MERHWYSNWWKDILLYIDSWKDRKHKRSFWRSPCFMSYWVFEQQSACFSKYGHKQTTYETVEGSYGEIQEQNPVSFTRSKLPLTGNTTCFLCNTKRNVDNNQYKEGGIARYSLEATAEKLLQKNQFYLKDENHQFYEASKGLDIKLSGSSHDIYAADIFYHQSCYVKYVHSRSSAILDSEINYIQNIRKTVLEIFFSNVKIKILYKKEGYFLHELLNDVFIISETHGLDETAIKYTVDLKRKLIA